jgi:hypothetical protein
MLGGGVPVHRLRSIRLHAGRRPAGGCAHTGEPLLASAQRVLASGIGSCPPLALCQLTRSCLAALSQRLDQVAAGAAQASILLQLVGAVWRLVGQVVAVETLVFLMLRPRVLQQLHRLLASGLVSLSEALRSVGLSNREMTLGELMEGLLGTCWL